MVGHNRSAPPMRGGRRCWKCTVTLLVYLPVGLTAGALLGILWGTPRIDQEQVSRDKLQAAVMELTEVVGEISERQARRVGPNSVGNRPARLSRVNRKADKPGTLAETGIDTGEGMMKGVIEKVVLSDEARAPVEFEEGVKVVGPDLKDKEEYSTLVRLKEGVCNARDCRVLITGCGRSGTHFMADQLMSAGILIKHEQIGKVGTVSWVHAAPYTPQTHELENWFSDNESTDLRASGSFQFFPVFHLVRHPLDTISSLTECFCGCGSMSCGGWADSPSWRWAGKFVTFSDRLCTRKQHNEVCVGYTNSLKGRLMRSMEYWVRWNRLVDSQAHYRMQVEKLDLSEVLTAAPQLSTMELGTGAPQLEKKPFAIKRGKDRKVNLDWKDLKEVNPKLEAEVWELAQSYGYGRNLP